MKATTQAWLDKAEQSFSAAQMFMEVPYYPFYDGVCLNSQFSAEQYLNACLREANVPFEGIQELPVLLKALLIIDPIWNCISPSIESLMPQDSEFGGFGYPGVFVNQDIAIQSLQNCRQVRSFVRSRLMSDEVR